jgi:predicted glutamine amidotransferase
MPVQQTNCHPFKHGKWLFQHNGYIDQWPRLRRDLTMAVAPELYPCIEGSTDSEVMFYLALTFGLADDPIGGLERMAGFVEATGQRVGVAEPLQMTIGLSDGERVYAARYASGAEANTLFVSTSVADLRALLPPEQRFRHFSDEARVVVSEPLIDLPGVWQEIAPGTALIVQDGPDDEVPFKPRFP